MSGSVGEVPGRLRLASLLSVALSGLCGLFSAWDAFSLLRLDELKQAQPLFKPPGDPALAERLWASRLLALEHMREPRMVVLFTLALACSLTFVASTRLLRPAGLPREGVRRILVWGLVVAAALRTINGAQDTVLDQGTADIMRGSLALPEGLSHSSAEEVRRLVGPAIFLFTILRTVLVVGPFLFLSQYFRSPGLKEWVARADARTP